MSATHPCLSFAGMKPGKTAHFVSCYLQSVQGAHTAAHFSFAEMWMFCLLGESMLMVHDQCSLRVYRCKLRPVTAWRIVWAPAARPNLSTHKKIVLIDNFHKLLCRVSASFHSTLSHASADTCGMPCWHSVPCLLCWCLFLHIFPTKSLSSGFALV